MGGASRATARRRYRRARRFHGSRRGVVAVIGTLLALLVFFALFGIFLTQYLPLWMTDNESVFTSEAASSFAQFKAAVDAQYILDGPQSYGTPFTVSSDGVPLLAQPTEGTLQFLPQTCPTPAYYNAAFYSPKLTLNGTAHNVPADYGQPVNPSYCVFANITEHPGPGGISYYSQSAPSGILEFVLPNRYYTPETYYFEDDAVIQTQSTGYQIMAVPPPLNITTVGNNVTVSSSFLQLFGNATAVITQGSQEVYSHLRFSTPVSSNGGNPPKGSNVTYEIGTQNPCAWSKYLVNLVENASGFPATARIGAAGFGTDYNFNNPENGTATVSGTQTLPYTGSCYNTNGKTTVLAVTILHVSFVTVYQAGLQVSLGIGAT